MTSRPKSIPVASQDGDLSRTCAKNPARSAGLERPREWFRDLLWAAFPGKSEREVSQRAAMALGVSQRQVQNWLRCEHDASLRHVAALMVIAGAEVVLGLIGGRR